MNYSRQNQQQQYYWNGMMNHNMDILDFWTWIDSWAHIQGSVGTQDTDRLQHTNFTRLSTEGRQTLVYREVALTNCQTPQQQVTLNFDVTQNIEKMSSIIRIRKRLQLKSVKSRIQWSGTCTMRLISKHIFCLQNNS